MQANIYMKATFSFGHMIACLEALDNLYWHHWLFRTKTFRRLHIELRESIHEAIENYDSLWNELLPDSPDDVFTFVGRFDRAIKNCQQYYATTIKSHMLQCK